VRGANGAGVSAAGSIALCIKEISECYPLRWSGCLRV
jgi:hypothetical protein